MDGIGRNERRKHWILVLTMAEYIFYTTEGFTQDPEGEDIENCQLIGRAFGDNKNEARNNLLKENPWIVEQGFNADMFISKELAPCENADKKLEFLTALLNEKQLCIYDNRLKSQE